MPGGGPGRGDTPRGHPEGWGCGMAALTPKDGHEIVAGAVAAVGGGHGWGEVTQPGGDTHKCVTPPRTCGTPSPKYSPKNRRAAEAAPK